jgi:hypothetical protein
MSGKTRAALDPADLDHVTGGAQVGGTAGNDRIRTDVTHDGGRTTVWYTDDVVSGGAGNDAIFTGIGEDTIDGGTGNDTIDSGMMDMSSDRVAGGEGNDTFLWAPASGHDTFEGGPGTDKVQVLMPPSDYFSLAHFLQGMSIDGAMMLVRHVEGNVVSFTDRAGNPIGVSGTLQTQYGLLSFSGVERFEFIPQQDMPRY